MVVEKQVGRFGEMYCGGGAEVLPVGVSVLRSQLVVAQISCLPRLPYNNLTCTEARRRRLSGTRPGPGAAPQLPSTITLLTGISVASTIGVQCP